MTEEEILSYMNQDYREIAEIVGVEKALKISEVLGGVVVTIPKLSVLHRAKRDKEIREEYDSKGLSVRQLAIKYGLTSRRIYDILGEKPTRKSSQHLPQNVLIDKDYQ